MTELMTTQIIVERPKKANKYGQSEGFIRALAMCRIQLKDQIIKDEAGQDILSQGVMYTTTEIAGNDEITYNKKRYKIMRVSVATDVFNKFQHYKGYLI